MGTLNATLLFAEPITTWVNATSLWVPSNWSIWGATAMRSTKPSSAPECGVSSFLPARGEFPASQGVLILTHPEKAWDNEVNQ
jgi:hypothetical protein